MTDIFTPKSSRLKRARFARFAPVIDLVQPFLGTAFAVGIIALAVSTFGPHLWTWMLAQSYTPQAPDWRMLQDLPVATLVHILGATLSLGLGAIVLFAPKGTPGHKLMGRIWALSMLITAVSSFFMKSFAPLLGQFGPIHVLSVWALISLPRAIWYIRKGDVEGHLKTMRGLYWGLCLAGLFTFMPGRTFYELLFG
jgi:uncharacterized membrane protein